MTATPTILANGVALAALGQAVESSLAVGAPLALTLASTAGYSSFAWVVLSRPFGSTATLTSETGYSTSITTDKPGRYRFRGSANGGEVRRDVEVILARSPGRGLRKATGTDKLADLVTKYNALADEMDLSARVYNVKAYGAKGDGTTDDTAAFNAATAAGTNVYVPPGVYMIDPSVGIKVRSWTHLYGAGKGASVLLASAAGGSIIKREFTAGVANEYVLFVHVEKLSIVLTHQDYTPSNYAQIGVDFRNITRSRVNDVYVGNFALGQVPGRLDNLNPQHFYVAGYGVVLGTQSSSGPDYCGGEVNVVERVNVFGAYKAIAIDDGVLSPSSAAHASVVRDCDVQFCTYGVAQLSRYTASVRITDNTVQTLYRPFGSSENAFAYYMTGTRGALDSGYVEVTGGAGIYLLGLDTHSNGNRCRLFSGSGLSVSDNGTSNSVETV